MLTPSVRQFRFLGIDWSVMPDHRSDTWVFISYWLFAGPIMLATFDEGIPVWMITAYFSYMVVLYTLCAWLIVNVLFPTYIPQRRYFFGFITMFIVLFTCATFNEVLEVQLNGKPFSWYSVFVYELANDSQNILTIVAVLAAKKFFDERQRNTELESERRQSELSRLRAQVDPHFLFNSLNILDILIEDDPQEARAFVHRLSNLYRYLIRHRDEDLVPAAAELQYARDYHYLVEQRFGASFAFRQNLPPDAELQTRYLPPGALQTVLENVYKHNLATERQPVTITVEQRGQALYVTNDFAPKPGGIATEERSGSGVANLLRRYGLLTDEEVYSRREGEQWVVRLPLVGMAGAEDRVVPTRRPISTTS